VLVLAVGGFVAANIGDRAFRADRRAPHERGTDTVELQAEQLHADQLQGEVRRMVTSPARRQTLPPDQLRHRVDNLKPGTYIDDILGAQDSSLYRWSDGGVGAVNVYVEPWSPAAGWDPAYVELARTAFAEWNDAGFPLRFNFILDSAGAAITVRWTERFPAEDGQRIGVTERIHTKEFWIASARIDIANHDSTGRQLPIRMLAGTLRHEIGHALGLNHAADATSVMYRESAATTISPSDRATLRLLYLVPPGSLR
jgi:predicted Zn-dependent protease